MAWRRCPVAVSQDKTGVTVRLPIMPQLVESMAAAS